jgi:hypothetical protein
MENVCHAQSNGRLKNRLRENLEMTSKEARSLIKQKFLIVQPSYNKLWRGRKLTIVYLSGSWEWSTGHKRCFCLY